VAPRLAGRPGQRVWSAPCRLPDPGLPEALHRRSTIGPGRTVLFRACRSS